MLFYTAFTISENKLRFLLKLYSPIKKICRARPQKCKPFIGEYIIFNEESSHIVGN